MLKTDPGDCSSWCWGLSQNRSPQKKHPGIVFLRSAMLSEDQEETQADVSQMSLQDLEQQTIMFGKAKYRMKFPQAFEDVSWTLDQVHCEPIRNIYAERERESASPVHPVCPPSPSPAGSRRIEPRGEVLPPPTRAAVISRPGTEEDTHDCDQIQGQGQELSICSVTSDICTGAATDRPVMTQVIQTEEIDDRKHPPRDRSPPEDTRLRDKRDSASLDGCEKRTTGDLSSAEHDKISAECFSAQHLADQSLDFELWNEAKTKALRNRHVHDIRMELEQVKNIIKNKSSKPSFLFELKPKEKPQESCFMYEIFCFFAERNCAPEPELWAESIAFRPPARGSEPKHPQEKTVCTPRL